MAEYSEQEVERTLNEHQIASERVALSEIQVILPTQAKMFERLQAINQNSEFTQAMSELLIVYAGEDKFTSAFGVINLLMKVSHEYTKKFKNIMNEQELLSLVDVLVADSNIAERIKTLFISLPHLHRDFSLAA